MLAHSNFKDVIQLIFSCLGGSVSLTALIDMEKEEGKLWGVGDHLVHLPQDKACFGPPLTVFILLFSSHIPPTKLALLRALSLFSIALFVSVKCRLQGLSCSSTLVVVGSTGSGSPELSILLFISLLVLLLLIFLFLFSL